MPRRTFEKGAAYQSVQGARSRLRWRPRRGRTAPPGEHLNEAREHFVEIKSHFGANHPEYRKAEAKLREVESSIEAAVKDVDRGS